TERSGALRVPMSHFERMFDPPGNAPVGEQRVERAMTTRDAWRFDLWFVPSLLQKKRWAALLGAVVLMTATVAHAQTESPITDSHACTIPVNNGCGVTACGELGTSRGIEQLVCCGIPRTFVHKLCTGNPGSVNACGQVGPLGCSVCS